MRHCDCRQTDVPLSFDRGIFENLEVQVPEIRYAQVNPAAVLAREKLGFARVYREAFAGEPWYEEYADAEILADVWDEHIDTGVIILASIGEQVVGLGCAQPLAHASRDVQEFLASAPSFMSDPATTWYMSELAVDAAHRRHGIGKQLVRHRMITASHRGGTHFVFRTAVQGSNSLLLYKNLGAVELTERQDMAQSQQVLANHSQSTERVYLHGEIGPILKLF